MSSMGTASFCERKPARECLPYTQRKLGIYRAGPRMLSKRTAHDRSEPVAGCLSQPFMPATFDQLVARLLVSTLFAHVAHDPRIVARASPRRDGWPARGQDWPACRRGRHRTCGRRMARLACVTVAVGGWPRCLETLGAMRALSKRLWPVDDALAEMAKRIWLTAGGSGTLGPRRG
eukprot:1524725-Pleurochrysis_carterae.AAC.1